MPYAAAVFDLDGTLLDTESVAIAAGVQALAELGHEVDETLLHRFVGKDEKTNEATLAAFLGQTVPFETLLPRWNAIIDRRHRENGIRLRPGAAELLDRLDALGLPRAVATSSRLARAEWKLDHAGLGGRFATIVSYDCVTRPKPAPEPFLLAAERLGLAPATCLAFEDSDTGAASARAAGMTVVQVPDTVPTDGRHAHHVAADLMAGARAAGLAC